MTSSSKGGEDTWKLWY